MRCLWFGDIVNRAAINILNKSSLYINLYFLWVNNHSRITGLKGRCTWLFLIAKSLFNGIYNIYYSYQQSIRVQWLQFSAIFGDVNRFQFSHSSGYLVISHCSCKCISLKTKNIKQSLQVFMHVSLQSIHWSTLSVFIDLYFPYWVWELFI